jgi:hypothetical protein
MKRTTALAAYTFLDLFALATAYFMVYRPLNDVFAAFASQAAFIKYNTTFFLGFGSIMIPVGHVIGIIETYLPRYFNRKICTRIFYGSLIISLLIGIGAAASVKQSILNRGYFICENAGTYKRLLRIKIYVRDIDTCHRLTLDKENRTRAGLR